MADEMEVYNISNLANSLCFLSIIPSNRKLTEINEKDGKRKVKFYLNYRFC